MLGAGGGQRGPNMSIDEIAVASLFYSQMMDELHPRSSANRMLKVK